MKIRICSDLHVDINNTVDYGFTKKLDEVDLNIIAGDIAGSYQTETAFLSILNTKTPVVCVGGNHLGYDYLYRPNRIANPNDGTKEFSIYKLTSEYNTNPIYYLENSRILVGGKIVFAGTMYSDFAIYGDPKLYGQYAEKSMNDFRNVYTNDGETIRPVQYEDYIMWFNKFMDKLKSTLEETKEDGLDVIVVTHFAPSGKSISNKYNGRYKTLNPAYVSNLESFIKDNSRIKLWVHGHMHDKFDYNVGQCRVVCEPYGYHGYEQPMFPENYEGKVIELE